MAFWNVSKSSAKKTYEQQIEEYELKGKPFTKAVLLCALDQSGKTGSEQSCQWKDLNDAISQSASRVMFQITLFAALDNQLFLLLRGDTLVRQPKMRAIIAFTTFVMYCVLPRLAAEGATINGVDCCTKTLGLLFSTVPRDEWDKMVEDLARCYCEAFNKIDKIHLNAEAREAMSSIIPGYIMSFNPDFPKLASDKYLWAFKEYLAILLSAEEGRPHWS